MPLLTLGQRADLSHGAPPPPARRLGAAQERAQAVSALATGQGFRSLQGHAILITGRALAEQGETASGLEQMRQGLAVIKATGQISGRMEILSLLAEAYALDGQPEAGLKALAAALDLGHARGLRLWEAEVHRLGGELCFSTKAGPHR